MSDTAYTLSPITPEMLDDDPSLSGGRWLLSFGPQHPATHTVFQFILELDGEVVVGCTPHIGYLHSGFEKQGEAHTFNQYVTVTDRMNYVSPIANNMAWHFAVEKLFGIELTDRCRWIRTLMCELGRIADHLLTLGTATIDLGSFTGFIYAFEERETIYELNEIAAGQRFHTSYSRIGGLMYDLPDDFWPKLDGLLARLPRILADFESLFVRNRIFLERTVGVGVIGAEEAINWSLTGPVARASGVRRDLRKDEPYYAYADLDFKVPVADGGDCYARFVVRLEEIRQSVELIKQIRDRMPAGPVNAPLDLRALLPPKEQVYGSIEGLIWHFEIVMSNRGYQVPIGEAYGANETANGELGFYVVADGKPTIYRARCRPPSFLHLAVMPRLLIGHQVSDLVAILGSLNIIAAELER